MTPSPYQNAPLTVRDDLAAAHGRALERLARPGTWWTGAERLAIAAEARHAPNCALCRARKEALTPNAVTGRHDAGSLPEPVLEAVHRIRTDPGRLSRSWLDGVLAQGLSVERYVEIVGVVATVVALDTFARGLGWVARPLPAPVAGAPSERRPRGAKPGVAWVPWLEKEDATDEEAGLYPFDRPAANIYKAMSLVPAEVRGFFDVVEAQYLPGAVMRDFAREIRAITHAQIELLAARVSALNRCVY
ncbi:MAG: hypothetical protein HY060_17920 [Proteobacteria bacterium]|nr:hypothetical protein [Pseudomonadota bacterium]